MEKDRVFLIDWGDGITSWIKKSQLALYEMKLYNEIEYDEKAKETAMNDIGEEAFEWDETVSPDEEVIRIFEKMEEQINEDD